MQPHSAAEIFPLMVGGDLNALIADIRDNGQREPIIVHDGLILDGRNRFRACQQLGIEPVIAPWDQKGTPEAFVVSMNLHRRHLNASQRAMIAAKLATRTKQETLIPNAANRKLDDRIQSSSLSIGQAADLLNVGRSSVIEAKKVVAEATPEEREAIERGETSVSKVAKTLYDRAPRKRKPKDAPLAATGKNPERIQRLQMQAELWARLSDALIGLTSLPLPSDVVQVIAANNSRARAVDDRLSRSLQWLKDFEHAWRNRDQASR